MALIDTYRRSVNRDVPQRTTVVTMGFPSWLTLLFIGLKLTGYIDWSWLWVGSPIWIALLADCVVILCAIVVLIVVQMCDKRKR